MIPNIKTLNKKIKIHLSIDRYVESFNNCLKAIGWSEQDLLCAIDKEWNDIIINNAKSASN